jgi:hypothetical protein
MSTRVRLLETDADAIEGLLLRHIEETSERLDTLVVETRSQTDALRKSISSNARLGVGILSSLVVASMMLAVNIILTR